MAKNLTAIRTTIRQMLRDEFQVGETTDFSPDELDLHINECLVEISLKRPYEVRETVVSAGSRDLDISSITNLLKVIEGEYPTGQYPTAYCNVRRFADTLTLDLETAPTSGEDIYLYCHKLHQLTDSGSTLELDAEKVLVDGAVAKAARAWLNRMRSQIVPASYKWYHEWSNNQFVIYQQGLASIELNLPWASHTR